MTVNRDQVKTFLQNKIEKEQKENRVLWKRAKSESDQIIESIIQKINPEKIIQWGSILDTNKFRDYSDIDIALCGVSRTKDFFQAQKIAMEIATFPVDIVDFDKLDENFKKSIMRRGTVVYER